MAGAGVLRVPAAGVRRRDQARRQGHQGRQPCGLHRGLRSDDERRASTVKAPASTMPPPTLDGQDSDETPTKHAPRISRSPRSCCTRGRQGSRRCAQSSASASSAPPTIKGLDYAKLYLARLAPIAAADTGRPPDRRDGAPACARHGVRGHDPRRRTEDPPVALPARARRGARSTMGRSSRSRSSCIRARGDRRHAARAARAVHSSTRAGCAD